MTVSPSDFHTCKTALDHVLERNETLNEKIKELAHEMGSVGVFLQERPTPDEVRRVGLNLEQQGAELQEGGT